MSRDRYVFHDNDHPYFVTCTVLEWLPIFANPEAVDIVLDSWNWLIQRRRIALFGYVVLENHLHWLFEATNPSREVAAFKAHTAKELVKLLQREGRDSNLSRLRRAKLRHKSDRHHQLWQEGSHPKALLTREMLVQKLEYTHDNPVRRGYVGEAEHWCLSSARDYTGRPGRVTVTRDW
jgi:putative transposase